MTSAKIDINEFYELARTDLASILASAAVGSSIIFNDSGSDVEMFVYNFADTVYWIPAQQTKIAYRFTGAVAASGTKFKVHPNNVTNDQFIVEPNQAYVYRGPGKIEKVENR